MADRLRWPPGAMDRHGVPVTCPHTGDVLQPCTRDTPMLDGLQGRPGPSCVPSLLFAYDANLLALSAECMNYLRAQLDIFCGAFGMKVNVPKCELLVFHPYPAVRAARAADGLVCFKRVAMPVTQRARYFGLFYGRPASRRAGDALSLLTGSHVRLLAARRRAVHLLRAKLAAHGLAIPGTAMTFINTCIRNVLCFGA